MKLVFIGLNGAMLLDNIIIIYSLYIAGRRSGLQQIEAVGIYIGFVLPLAMAILLLLLQRHLAHGLRGMGSPNFPSYS